MIDLVGEVNKNNSKQIDRSQIEPKHQEAPAQVPVISASLAETSGNLVFNADSDLESTPKLSTSTESEPEAPPLPTPETMEDLVFHSAKTILAILTSKRDQKARTAINKESEAESGSRDGVFPEPDMEGSNLTEVWLRSIAPKGVKARKMAVVEKLSEGLKVLGQ